MVRVPGSREGDPCVGHLPFEPALFLAGALIMAWNLWRTVYPREAPIPVGETALNPAQ